MEILHEPETAHREHSLKDASIDAPALGLRRPARDSSEFSAAVTTLFRRRKSADESAQSKILAVCRTRSMQKNHSLFALLAVPAILLSASVLAQKAGESPADHLPPPITPLTSFGERADWSSDGRRILFLSKTFGDAMEIDLATKAIRNLTADYPHHGYTRVLYLANGDILLAGPELFDPKKPDEARRHCFLYVLDKSLTKPAVPLGTLCSEGPAVSRKRLHIAWTQWAESSNATPSANSQMLEADIVYENGRPMLANQKPIIDNRALPFPCTLETQNFRPPDEKELTFSAYNPPGTKSEVCGVDLATKKVTNYTQSPQEYDEPEGIYPDGQYTLVECDKQNHQGPGHIDIWRLRLDGSGQYQRLTFFSDYPGYKASNPVVSDDGRFIAFQLGMSRNAAGVGHGLFIYDTLASPLPRAADAVTNQSAPASNTVAGTAAATATPGRWGGGFDGGNNAATELDHRRMMDLLQISSIRRGRDGNNPQSPYYANYDESKANPFPNLPDALLLKNGQKVTTAAMWWNQRRPEIVEDFDREIYGRVPAETPRVNWEATSTTRETNGAVPVIVKQLVGRVDNSSYPAITVNIQVTLTTPANATGPVPVMMQFGGFGAGGLRRGGFGGFGGTNAPGGTNGFRRGDLGGGFGGSGPGWQQQVLAKGWGYATISPNSIQADNGAGLTQGIIGLLNRGQTRKADDWGALHAWAWGASRALDYFETDRAVDAKRVGLEGHSRYGKTTLVAMAYDRRFAIAYVSSSGEGGAKLHRRNWGEVVENVAGSGEYHWMAGNFIKYAGPLNWGDLPVDSHELITLCAPRPVFLSAGATKGDGWVDAKGTFMAGVGAGPVYRLLGGKDLGTTEFPPIETPLVDGDVAFRQHSGGHTDAPNWPTFLKFADKYFSSGP